MTSQPNSDLLSKCHVKLFGRTEVRLDNLRFSTPKKLFALLGLLATNSNRVSRSELIEVVWDPFHAKKSNASFRQFLVRVRSIEKSLGTNLLEVKDGFLHSPLHEIKSGMNGVLGGHGVNSLPHETQKLEEFLCATNDLFLEDIEIDSVSFAHWKRGVQENVNQRRVSAITRLIQGFSDEPNAIPLETLAGWLLKDDPGHELGYRVLMELHCRNGNRSEAMKTYSKCRQVLLDDYNVTPEISTRQLAAELGLVSEPNNCTGDIQATVANARVPVTAGSPRLLLLPPRNTEVADANPLLIDALLDDVTAGLTRFRSIAVIAAHSARSAVAKISLTPRELGTQYGAQYVVRTTVTETGGKPTLLFMLIDSRSERVLAAFDLLFNEQDFSILFERIGHEIVNRLVQAIEVYEVEFPTAAGNRTAYRYFLEGRKSLWHSDLPFLRRARKFFKKSLNEYDRFAPAYAGVARTLSMERLVCAIPENDLLLTSCDLAEKAIRTDPLDGRGFREKAFANLYLKRHDDSLEYFLSAEKLNPNDADLIADYADALSHAGEAEAALEKCLQAKQLNPDFPQYYDWVHGSILYQMGRYRDVVDLLRTLEANPALSRLLAASHAMAGNISAANTYAQILRETYPDFNLKKLALMVPDRNAYDTKHLLEGLRTAGIA